LGTYKDYEKAKPIVKLGWKVTDIFVTAFHP